MPYSIQNHLLACDKMCVSSYRVKKVYKFYHRTSWRRCWPPSRLRLSAPWWCRGRVRIPGCSFPRGCGRRARAPRGWCCPSAWTRPCRRHAWSRPAVRGTRRSRGRRRRRSRCRSPRRRHRCRSAGLSNSTAQAMALAQGEAGGLGDDAAKLVPLLGRHVLGHQGMLGFNLGERRSHCWYWRWF